jgi:hypothetical protein
MCRPGFERKRDVVQRQNQNDTKWFRTAKSRT